MESNSHGAGDLCFDITYIQTETFSIPKEFLKLDKNRRFFVSASDGSTISSTSQVKLSSRSLRWNEILAGFTVPSSSQLTLRVLEAQKIRKDKLLATFVISYEMLHSSQNEFLLSSTQNTSSQTLSVKLSTRYVPAKKLPQGLPQQGDRPVPSSKEAHPHIPEVNGTGITSGLAATDVTKRLVTSPGPEDFVYKWKVVRQQVAFVATAVASIPEIQAHTDFAFSAFSFIPETVSEEVQLDNNVTDLLDAIVKALHLAPDDKTLDSVRLKSSCEQSGKQKETIKRLMNLITECGYFVQQYTKDPHFRKRLVTCNQKDVISKFREQLEQLHRAFVNENTVTVDISTLRILGHVESIDDRLEDLHLDTKFPFVQGARFNPEKGCLAGTRVNFLEAITNWINNVGPGSPRGLVLFGQAGTGKSSIAHEIAKRLHRTERLTTSYCFVRGKPSSREPHRFFTTLARNLCTSYPAFKTSLSMVVKKNPDILIAEDFTTLLRSLILEPLQDLQVVSPIVIVIDALDESEDASSRSLHSGDNRIPFHTFLGQILSELPAMFRILMTTRPETEITAAFPPSPFLCHMRMDDPELSGGVDDDILTYLRTRLQTSRTNVDDEDLQELARKAEQLFQWAAVASFYIANPPPGLGTSECIRRVLNPIDGKKALNPLDALYVTVLERFDMDDPDICHRFQSVMGRILGVYQPLSISCFNTMYRHAAADKGKLNIVEDVFAIVEHLGSLLSNVTVSDSEQPVFPLHTSFRDFLINPQRSGKFYVNLDGAHGELAYVSVRTMQEMLKFNICELESSYRLNNDVPDLHDRVERCIPSALSYSCRFWAEHLIHVSAEHLTQVSKFKVKLLECIRVLMKEKFLFWLEVLSLRGELTVATTMLFGLRAWLGRIRDKIQHKGIDTLDPLIKDALAFSEYFGYPMAQSAPHIYLSALPFAPSSSFIAELYSSQFPRTINVKSGRLKKWPALVRNISVPNRCEVTCITWSRNDAHIAAGLLDGNIFVWDASMGTRISGPFSAGRKGGQDRVLVASVAFSHDGTCLASGLSNGRIRIWDLTTGLEAAVLGALKNPVHTGAVSALSFSQNGLQLMSGSMDHTVQIWDMEDGELVAGPFIGHKNPIWTVSFLPDQEHVVSRSGFRTVRVWNMKTEQSITHPFQFTNVEIPTGTIDATVCYDIFFFHDESRVKSGFAACPWTEAMAYEEEEYRPNFWIQPTAVSYDGKYIATSSPNHAHVWYANGESAGQPAGGPFHHERIICLSFSTDGQRIASGSEDGIICVWNVATVDEDGGQIATQGLPYSVAFTPDNKHVVVGRLGGTVQLLEALTGQEVVKIWEEDKEHIWPKVAVSLNGDLIVSTRNDEMLIWTREGESFTETLRHSNNQQIWCVAFSRDSNDLIAFGTMTGMVGVLNISTGALIAELKQICDQGVTCLALSSTTNGTSTTTQVRVAVGSYCKIFVWDIHSGNVTSSSRKSSSWWSAVVFSDDARYITSVAQDHTLCVWDSTTGSVVKGPVGFTDDQKVYLGDGRYQYTALTQDGQRVAFAGRHLTILVFEMLHKGDKGISLQGPLVLGGHAAILKGIAFSRDGRFLTTTSDDRTIRIWDLIAAAERKQTSINSNTSEIASFDEAFIDDDGWAVCPCDGGRSLLRLVWIPEMHRKTLHRPISVSVVVRDYQMETSMDLENFVYGKEWVKCKA